MEWWKFGIMGKLDLFIPHHSIIPIFHLAFKMPHRLKR